jgi:predicted TIM-barrel fold metal-dependent hydrolase
MNQLTPIADPLAGIKVIDVDTHWTEPGDLWTSRAPASIREFMPQRKIVDGELRWVMGDQTIYIMGAASVVAKDGSVADDMSFMKWQVEDVHPACSQMEARLALMDDQGAYAHVVYPNILGFGGQRAMLIDADHRLAATRIYNEALGEMQEKSGQRLFGMALLPWWDIELAVAEIERCAAMGLRGVNLNSAPHIHGLPDLADDYWNPLWEACVKHDLPINFHIGASDDAMTWFGTAGWGSLSDSRRMAVGGAMLTMDQVKIVLNILVSGILDRFPTLKIVSVESGIGWIPFFLQQLDYGMKFNPGKRFHLELTPKEYFRRNFTACFWFENENMESIIRDLGEDNVMFETDFPHPTCLYPAGLERVTAAVKDRTLLEKICSTNAARVYNIPL